MKKLAYILAVSHSGSTLLSMLLASHPQVATVGELRIPINAMGDLDRYRCSCGQFIHQCDFWQKVTENMGLRGYKFDIGDAGTDYQMVDSRYAGRLLGPLHRGWFLESIRDVALGLSIAWRRQLAEIHRRNAALAATVCEIKKAEVVVDSSKKALRLKYLLRNPELDVKVIRLIRDGRAIALTSLDTANFADATNPALRGGGTGWLPEQKRFNMAQAAFRWKRNNEEAENILRHLDISQWIEVRYEELCSNTDKMLSRLFEFLGVDPQKRIKDFRSVDHHVIGNGMRLDTTSDIQLDERWRSVLTEDDLKIFAREAGKMNREYGYK